MEPDEFDRLFKEKLDQLDRAPHMAWDDNRVWEKIRPKSGINYKGLFTISVLLLCLGIIWLQKPAQFNTSTPLPIQQRIENKATQPTQKQVETHSSTPTLLPEEKRTRATALKEGNTLSENHLRKRELALLGGNRRDAVVRQLEAIPLDSVPRQYPISDKTREAFDGAAVEEETALPKLLVLATPALEKETREIYAGWSANGAVTGINHVKYISKRFAVVYGARLSQALPSYTDAEHPFALASALSLQVPLQLRYYMLPKENRLSAFVYEGITITAPLSTMTAIHRPGIRLEGGVEARYRLDKRGTTFFFLRMPIGNSSMMPYRVPGRP